jgi:hypothetical protein
VAVRALRESPSWSERLNAIAIAVEVFGCHNVVVMQALRWGQLAAGQLLACAATPHNLAAAVLCDAAAGSATTNP